MKKLISVLLVLLLLPLSVSLAEEKPLTSQAKLPTDDFSGGEKPSEAGYYLELREIDGKSVLVSCYSDESIFCEVYERRMYNADCHIAHVKIADASQLRTAVASEISNKTKLGTTKMAEMLNGVVAISGDYYTYRKAASFVARQSKIIKGKPSSVLDQLIIDYNGDFHIIIGEDKNAEVASYEGQIYQSFTFGPALVVDGVVQEKKDYTFDASGRSNQRSAIGQIGPLEYLLIVVDGRTDASKGMSCWNLAKAMAELGCVQAFNLDGGGSATFVWKNARQNTPVNKGDRAISDCIYFATTVGE